MATEKRDYKVKIVFYDLPDLPSNSVKSMAKWLRAQADYIEKNSKKVSRRYIAKMMK
jgi:hypothetical protein